MKRFFIVWAVFVSACSSASTSTEQAAAPSADVIPPVPNELPLKYVGPATHAAIAASDMMTRLYILADDSMMGRSAATPYNAKGALYIEREVKRLGLEPAGENGTYFQFPLDQRELDPSSSLSVNGRAFTTWTDFAPRDQGPQARAFDGAPVVYAGSLGDPQRLLPPSAVAGKIALLTLAKDSTGRANFNVNRAQITARFLDAAAIAVVSIDYLPPGYIDRFYQSPQVLPKGASDSRVLPSYFYVTKAVAQAMLGRDAESAQPGAQGATVRGQIRFTARTRRPATSSRSSRAPIRRCAGNTSPSVRITITSGSTIGRRTTIP